MGLDEDYVFIDPDVSGSAQVVYGGKAYTGADLDIIKADYGILATIITDIVPGMHTKRLTVLIPPVNFPGDVGGAYVTSQAIVSTEHASFGGPDPVSAKRSPARRNISWAPPLSAARVDHHDIFKLMNCRLCSGVGRVGFATGFLSLIRRVEDVLELVNSRSIRTHRASSRVC